jgi:protein-S-isoprenylcysteine O-methyltransferase Ste14
MALREYDLGRFSGLSQIKAHRRGAPEPGDEPLIIHGMHQFVRHPLYLGAYLIFWGGAGDDFGLATAIWGSLYLWIGARHEERSLLALYGQAYTAYQTQVPAIVPWKRRAPN